MTEPLIYVALIVGGFVWGAGTTWITVRATYSLATPKAPASQAATVERVIAPPSKGKRRTLKELWASGTPWSHSMAVMAVVALIVGGTGTWVVISNQATQQQCTRDYSVYDANRSDINGVALERMIRTVTSSDQTIDREQRQTAIDRWFEIREALGPLPTLEEFCAGDRPKLGDIGDIPAPTETPG